MISQHKKNLLLSTWQHLERNLIHVNKLGHNDPQLSHYSNTPPSNANLKRFNNVKFFCFITRCRQLYFILFFLSFQIPNFCGIQYLFNNTNTSKDFYRHVLRVVIDLCKSQCAICEIPPFCSQHFMLNQMDILDPTFVPSSLWFILSHMCLEFMNYGTIKCPFTPHKHLVK